jgi:hypothetical protein
MVYLLVSFRPRIPYLHTFSRVFMYFMEACDEFYTTVGLHFYYSCKVLC